MTSVQPLTPADAGWAARVLASRRRALVSFAPVFWNPAPDQLECHTRYLAAELAAGTALGWRCGDSVLIASHGRTGWLIDDAAADWERDGAELWSMLVAADPDAPVVFVCPVYEPDRMAFAVGRGLRRARTWWLRELQTRGGTAGDRIEFADGQAMTVNAPPVYAPGGPMLLADDLGPDVDPAALIALAQRRGCAGVVVNETGDAHAAALRDAGLRPHCDYLAGNLAE